jgi:hypothetical protein
MPVYFLKGRQPCKITLKSVHTLAMEYDEYDKIMISSDRSIIEDIKEGIRLDVVFLIWYLPI